MRSIFCFFLFLSAALAAETPYQEHLPKDLYEHITQTESIDETLLENLIEKQFEAGGTLITIHLENDKDGEPLVALDFWLENAVDNFHGIQVGYRNGCLLGYAIFDEKGRDYVAFAPFSSNDEQEIKRMILELMKGAFPPSAS